MVPILSKHLKNKKNATQAEIFMDGFNQTLEVYKPAALSVLSTPSYFQHKSSTGNSTQLWKFAT